jgi:hypothetical protein
MEFVVCVWVNHGMGIGVGVIVVGGEWWVGVK